jgi:pantoate--beta-alanine ligase
MELLKTIFDLEKFTKNLSNKTMALVPTMGALHDGHLALVVAGQKQADICLPYIFLNPTQFAPHEDLDQYPKTLEADLEKLEQAGVKQVWLPIQQDIYPNGLRLTHHAGDISKPLEGECRPHFFDGVVTVLHRMFSLSGPDFVMMGEKDFQQLQVVKNFVQQEKMSINVIGIPTIRDNNGLALSSRNIYLSEDEYTIAIQLNEILKELASKKSTEEEAHKNLLNAGFDKIDYCTCRNAENFEPKNANRVLAAVWLGKTRLIDNLPMTA